MRWVFADRSSASIAFVIVDHLKMIVIAFVRLLIFRRADEPLEKNMCKMTLERFDTRFAPLLHWMATQEYHLRVRPSS
jgi:hypothetical protein